MSDEKVEEVSLNDLQIENEKPALVFSTQQELSCENYPPLFEELDEQETQAVNGGAKIGNPGRMLNEATSPTGSEVNTMFHESPSRSDSARGNSLKERWNNLPTAWKAEGLASTVVGPVTAFGVGLGGNALVNTVSNKKASQ